MRQLPRALFKDVCVVAAKLLFALFGLCRGVVVAGVVGRVIVEMVSAGGGQWSVRERWCRVAGFLEALDGRHAGPHEHQMPCRESAQD